MAPWRGHARAKALLPQRTPPSRTCPPSGSLRPTGSSCVLGLLSESVWPHQGVWPRTQWGCTGVPGGLAPPTLPGQVLAVLPGEEKEAAGGATVQPPERDADGTGPGRTDSRAQKWPLLAPQTV